MRRIAIIALALTCLAACRGEPVPRDYQNAPPAMTHPPDSKAEAPSQHGMGQATPEPNAGAEGTAAPTKPVDPTATSTTGTTGTTTTSGTSATTAT